MEGELLRSNTFNNFRQEGEVGKGRNELRSSGFSDGFFRRHTSLFLRVGKMAVCSDALHTLVMTGASTSAASFTSHVGIGSSGQCLHGALRISLRISLVVTGWNADSVEDGRLRISGGLV